MTSVRLLIYQAAFTWKGEDGFGLSKLKVIYVILFQAERRRRRPPKSQRKRRASELIAQLDVFTWYFLLAVLVLILDKSFFERQTIVDRTGFAPLVAHFPLHWLLLPMMSDCLIRG